MSLPVNKQIKDLFEGLLGREVTIHDGLPIPADASPRPTTGVYVDDAQTMTTVVVIDFALTAYCGAALALVPKDAAGAAIEDRDLPDSLLDNTAEILNVLAAPIGEARGAHQRLLTTYGPRELPPREVQELATQAAGRLDLLLEVKGYGEGILSLVATQH